MRIVMEDPRERARLQLLRHTSELRNLALEATRSEDGEDDARRGLVPATLVLAEALAHTEWEPLARAASLLQQIARAALVADARGVFIPCCGVVEQMVDHCVEESTPDPARLADLLERLAALIPPVDLLAPEAETTAGAPESEEPVAEVPAEEPVSRVADRLEEIQPRMESLLDRIAASPFDGEALGELETELKGLQEEAHRAGAEELATYIEPAVAFVGELRAGAPAESLPADRDRVAGVLLRLVASIEAMILCAGGRGTEDHVPEADLRSIIEQLRSESAAPATAADEEAVEGELQPQEEAALDAELAEAFAEESAEIFARCDQLLEELAARPSDPRVLHDLFRAFHTLKGAAASVGLHQIAGQFLPAEDLFEDMAEAARSSGTVPVDPARLVDFAYRLVESGKGLADRARGRSDSPHAVLDNVEDLVRSVRDSTPPPEKPEAEPVAPPAAGAPGTGEQFAQEVGFGAELAESFAEESAELFARCESLVERLGRGEDMVPVLRDLFRALRSIKGVAASVGLSESTDVFREGEELFEHLYEESAKTHKLAVDAASLAEFTRRLLRFGYALAQRAAGKPVAQEDLIDDLAGEIAKLRSRRAEPTPPAPPSSPGTASSGSAKPERREPDVLHPRMAVSAESRAARGGSQKPPIKTTSPEAARPAPGTPPAQPSEEPVRVTPRVGASSRPRRRRGSTTHRRRR